MEKGAQLGPDIPDRDTIIHLTIPVKSMQPVLTLKDKFQEAN